MKSFSGTIILALVFTTSLPTVVNAQTREKGPWWPNAQWGAEDAAGGSNWITPDKVLKATALVKTGRVIELGHVYERGMPLNGSRSYNIFIPSFPTHGPILERQDQLFAIHRNQLEFSDRVSRMDSAMPRARLIAHHHDGAVDAAMQSAERKLLSVRSKIVARRR